MNENQSGSNNLLDTTDCLESVGVFKGWKNFFFIIVIICLLLVQICFWLVNIGWISVPPEKTMTTAETEIMLMPITAEFEQDMSQDANEASQEMAAESEQPGEPNEPATMAQTMAETNEPEMTAEDQTVTMAEEQAVESEQAAEEIAETAMPEAALASEQEESDGFLFGITFDHLVWVLRFANALLVLTATLYCLTILFSLKVSMLGRLGGINHITRAFFLSLLALVLILPWQRVFSPFILGAIFTPEEMVDWYSTRTPDLFDTILYYLRFCGYWLLVLLLMILAQIRSSRWAGAILRRLEII
jgi:hypothetical protein